LEDSDCVPSKTAEDQVQGSKVTRKTFEDRSLGTGGLNFNGQTDNNYSDILHDSIEDLSQRLENSHISEQSESHNGDESFEDLSQRLDNSHISEQSVSNHRDNLDASELSEIEGPSNNTLDSSIGKDSVFRENYSDSNSLVNEDVHMDSARELETRLSVLEDNHSKVEERIFNLANENRRGSVKRVRDIEEDELDRSADGIKTQKMSDTLLVRGRPKGSTNEVQQRKLEEDRQNRDKDRKDRYSISDVVTRRVTKLLSKN
jgi:hypothetical protein